MISLDLAAQSGAIACRVLRGYSSRSKRKVEIDDCDESKDMSETWDLIIIGGGAAGFYAAITCAEANQNARVLIVEKSARVLQKVRISGGGRCNVTHDRPDPKRMASFYPRGNRALIGPLHHFGVLDTIRWFESRGVQLKTESDGRMFPTTDDSATIIDCLRGAADRAGVEVRTSTAVKQISPVDSPAFDGFEVALHRKDTLRAQKVLLATGGTRSASAASLARRLGHALIPAVPSLFTFNIDDPRIAGLAGVSVEHAKARVQGEKLNTDGPILVTHWGLSGPAILKLSAWGARELNGRDYAFKLEVNWLPGVDVSTRFHELRSDWGKRQVSTRSPFDEIPKRLWESLVEAAEIPPDCRWAELPKARSQKLGEHLTQAHFEVTGKSTNKDEFVTCGGVPTDEVDTRTFESRVCEGVYFAGEVLNIDGVTGGYNFQNAWTTAHLAGHAIAAELAEN